MPPPLLIDLDAIDLTQVLYNAHDLEEFIPQRGDMMHVDGVIWADDPKIRLAAVGYKDVRDDEFWVPGHIPGRPLLPGVLMIEAAAQLASFLMKKYRREPGFLGFVGCDNVKFRGQVSPGHRLYILGHETQYKPGRRFVCAAQGVVEGKLVFEAEITGMSF
jgi:3-hydroxyacyl-[acyl-carrier-protein] dehydratase